MGVNPDPVSIFPSFSSLNSFMKLLIATFIYNVIIIELTARSGILQYCTHGAYTFRNRFIILT